MTDLGAGFSTAAKYLAVAVLALLVISPCIAIVWKGTNLRRGLWRAGCWRWVICCDRIYGERVTRADLMERGHGAQTVEAYYQLMFAKRPSPMLTLTTWRENLRHHAHPGLSTKLAQIQIKDERIDRDEQLVLPQCVPTESSGRVKQADRPEPATTPVALQEVAPSAASAHETATSLG